MKNQLFNISLIRLVCWTFCALLCSCSIQVEKRRYRPGYYVQVSPNVNKTKHHEVKHNPDNEWMEKTKQKSEQPTDIATKEELKDSTPATRTVLKTYTEDIEWEDISIDLHEKEERSISPEQENKSATQVGQGASPKETLGDNKRRRRVWAWITGGVAFALLIGSILMFSLIGGWYGVNIILGAIIIGLALIMAIIALLLRYSGYRYLPDINPHEGPVRKGKAGFALSIISLSLALIAFVFSFLANPMGGIGFGIAVATIFLSIISFSLGFSGLRSGKSVKVILAIVMGFIALLLASLAIMIVFL